MPTIEEINSKRKFKKKNYRAWNLTGEDQVTHSHTADDKGLQHVDTEISTSDILCELDTSHIINWIYHDRPESELGNIESLAQDMKIVGQQQPCIVRPHPNENDKFELIIGERRWRAAQYAKIKLKVIIRAMTDNEAALAQAAENDNRTDISDYAKGMHFSRLISQGIIKQKDLTDKLCKSRQYVSALLSYSKLPDEIIRAIGPDNMKNISSTTAERIKQLASKGEDYVQAIIEISEKLASGKVGHTYLIKHVNDKMEKRSQKEIERVLADKKVLSSDGRHIFTWRKDNNKLPSIHFPKSIIDTLIENEDKLNHLNDEFIKVIENELSKLKLSVQTDKRRGN